MFGSALKWIFRNFSYERHIRFLDESNLLKDRQVSIWKDKLELALGEDCEAFLDGLLEEGRRTVVTGIDTVQEYIMQAWQNTQEQIFSHFSCRWGKDFIKLLQFEDLLSIACPSPATAGDFIERRKIRLQLQLSFIVRLVALYRCSKREMEIRESAASFAVVWGKRMRQVFGDPPNSALSLLWHAARYAQISTVDDLVQSRIEILQEQSVFNSAEEEFCIEFCPALSSVLEFNELLPLICQGFEKAEDIKWTRFELQKQFMRFLVMILSPALLQEK